MNNWMLMYQIVVWLGAALLSLVSCVRVMARVRFRRGSSGFVIPVSDRAPAIADAFALSLAAAQTPPTFFATQSVAFYTLLWAPVIILTNGHRRVHECARYRPLTLPSTQKKRARWRLAPTADRWAICSAD